MRTTVTIDDELYKKALQYSDPDMPKGDIFRVALKVYIQVQASRRLASITETNPNIEDIPRSRYDWDDEEEDDDENNRNH